MASTTTTTTTITNVEPTKAEKIESDKFLFRKTCPCITYTPDNKPSFKDCTEEELNKKFELVTTGKEYTCRQVTVIGPILER